MIALSDPPPALPDPLPIRFMPSGLGERGFVMLAVGRFRHVAKPDRLLSAKKTDRPEARFRSDF